MYGAHGTEARLFKDRGLTIDCGNICVRDMTCCSSRKRASTISYTAPLTLHAISSSTEESIHRLPTDEWGGWGQHMVLCSNWYTSSPCPHKILFDVTDSGNHEVVRYSLDLFIPPETGSTDEGSCVTLSCIGTYQYPSNYGLLPMTFPPFALEVNPRISFGTLVYITEVQTDDELSSQEQEEWAPLSTRWAMCTFAPTTRTISDSSTQSLVRVTRFPFDTPPFTFNTLIGFCPCTGRIVFEGLQGTMAQEPKSLNMVDFLQI